MDIHFNPDHHTQFAAWQHVGEHLARERARLEHELRYVLAQAQRLDGDLTAFLQRHYGLDAQHVPVTLDSARGVLVVPDAPDTPDAPIADPISPDGGVAAEAADTSQASA